MDQNETLEPYTGADLVKDVSKSIAVSIGYQVIGTALALGALATAGFIAQKIEDRKALKNSTEN